MGELDSSPVTAILGCLGLRVDNPTDAVELAAEVAMLAA